MDPFRSLLKGSNPWEWKSIHTRAFEELKQNFVDCIVLKHTISDAPFKLQTNASNFGISGVLYQIDADGNHRVVFLVSQCLNTAELNYTTTEKELLAIVYSVTKLRTLLIGRKFEIITGHKGLIFLNKTFFLNSRLIRWSIVLQQYDFEHCSGRDNVIADIFSRNPNGRFEKTEPTEICLNNLVGILRISCSDSDCRRMNPSVELRNELKNLHKIQKNDLYCKGIINNIHSDDAEAGSVKV